MKSPLRVPKKETSQIERFAKRLSAGTGKLVDRDPSEHAIAGDCFNNVRSHIELYGGEMVTGWAVRVWPRVLIEAEAHAIWQDAQSRRLDVSPHLMGDKTTFFCQSSEELFSNNGSASQINRYCNIAIGKLRNTAEAFIRSAIAKQQYELRNKQFMDGHIVFTGNIDVQQRLFDEFSQNFKLLLRKSK